MSTLVIKPKLEEEQDLLTRLLEKMNIEVNILEVPVPNYKTRKAMGDVKDKKGTNVKEPSIRFTPAEFKEAISKL